MIQPPDHRAQRVKKLKRKTKSTSGHRLPKDTDADRKIGERIHYVRVTKVKARQSDFADRLGVSRGAVANWERGKGAKRENLQRISRTFRVSLEWLATGFGPPVEQPSLEAKMKMLPPDDYARRYEEFDMLLEMDLRRLGLRKEV